jgi:hypothetical protein
VIYGGAAVPLPTVEKARWWNRELPTTLLMGVPPCLTAAVTAAREFNASPASWTWKALALASGWLALATLVKSIQAHLKDKKQQRAESPLDLTGCLHVLHQAIAGKCRRAQDKQIATGCLRLTIHRLDGEHLQQCVPYVGGPGGKPGRKFSSRSGIIGRACLNNEVIVASRRSDDHDAFVQEMVSVWNFPMVEARELDPSRRAWMAVPLTETDAGDADCVIGVVYLDSNDKDLFTEDMQSLILDCVKGVAGFVRVRYAE